jgi:hypothetical protein
MSGAYPLDPAPSVEPRDKLSSQLVFDCASLRTMGWPSWRTLCTVMSALNVWISSARIGCLRGGQQCSGPSNAPKSYLDFWWNLATYTFMPCQNEAELL